MFYVVQKLNCSSECAVSLLWGHLVRYIIFVVTPLRVHRLGSLFNMMRISSIATNRAFFIQPFLRNWTGNLAPV